MKPKKFESSMAKMRLLPEDQYKDWKNHKCNENKIEKVDMLNKKYADTILDNKINENITREESAEGHLKADSDVQGDNISMSPILILECHLISRYVNSKNGFSCFKEVK